jgi:hypothetical protein
MNETSTPCIFCQIIGSVREKPKSGTNSIQLRRYCSNIERPLVAESSRPGVSRKPAREGFLSGKIGSVKTRKT